MAAKGLLGGGKGSSGSFSGFEAPVVGLFEGSGGLLSPSRGSSSGFPGVELAGGDHPSSVPVGELPLHLTGSLHSNL